jgi:hypothetical protein
MKELLPLFVMVDACGWEIIQDDPFCWSFAPHRKRLDSVFGYSSACVPSILSGRWPGEHLNWSYFVYDPVHSPFKGLRPLAWLPRSLTSRRIVRRAISRLVKWRLGFRGYFDLYNIPFEQIHLFDFSEKKSPLKPGGMNCGPNIFDWLEAEQIPYFSSDPDASEEQNRDALLQAIGEERIDFSFLYWPGLDGLLHQVGNDSPEIPARLRLYETWIEELLAAARQHYHQVHLYVFSDHGMANCDQHLDLKALIDPLGLRPGADYAVVYDSTMARFWFFNPQARATIETQLHSIPQGRIIPDQELQQLRTFFPDRRFGELIFLVREGVLIVPSHMGERPIRAMHGYHPHEKQSYAALLTNQQELPQDLHAIPDLGRLMHRAARLAARSNRLPPARLQDQLLEKEVA